MTQTMNSAPIDSISIYFPHYGVWTARVNMTGADAFPPDSTAQIILEDLVLNGTIKNGGVYLSKGQYLVVGGGGNWSRTIPPLGERSLAGIRLSAIAKSIQEAANLAGQAVGSEGEEIVSVPNDRFLGQFWQRQAGLASAALSALTNNQWYVDLDGTTVLNPRGTTTITQKYIAQDYDPIHQTVIITVPESSLLTGFVPGCVVSTGLPTSLTLKELTISSDNSGLFIEGRV